MDHNGNKQQWRMLCPETRQMQELNVWGEELKVVFNRAQTKLDAWSKLARPEKACYIYKCHEAPVTKSTLSKLETLSNEILDLIIEYLFPERSDVAAFGFSSERLWPLVRRQIQRHILESAAPWAGKKIVFHGSLSTDLPACFDEDTLPKNIVSADGFGSMTHAQRLFWHGCPKGSDTLRDQQLEWAGAVIAHAGQINIPDARWKELEKDMRCEAFFPSDASWLLRNHTTCEFVSSESLDFRATTKSKSRSGSVASFDYILLMRTCWTSSPGAKNGLLRIHRGVWAGHRFDIVTQRFHESEAGLGDWRDVTEEVASEAKELQHKLANR